MKYYFFEHFIIVVLGILANISLYLFANGFNIVLSLRNICDELL